MYKFPSKKMGLLRAITIVVVIFAIITMMVTGFHIIYIRTYVNGKSMLPILNSSLETTGKRDVVYINRFAKVDISDIVVLDLRNHPNFNGYAIKTLIAVEGDVVNISLDDDNMQYNLTVNNQVFYSKPYTDFNNTYNSFLQYIANHKDDSSRILKDDLDNTQGVIIKKGEIFVLGDNWEISKDSSLVGPINKSTIVGKVDIVVKPTQNEFLTILKRIF